MAARPAPTASRHASRESGSSRYGTVSRRRGGAASAWRMKRAMRPGYTGPSEFTCNSVPRSFSMSTISGSMNFSRGNASNSSSAGAGFSASKRLNEKYTGGCSTGPSNSLSAPSSVGSAMQRPSPI